MGKIDPGRASSSRSLFRKILLFLLHEGPSVLEPHSDSELLDPQTSGKFSSSFWRDIGTQVELSL